MTRWEYHFEHIDGDFQQVVATANALGERGWELVGTYLFPLAGAHLLFKRPLSQISKAGPTPGDVRKHMKGKKSPAVNEL